MRWFRRDFASQMKKNIKELDAVDSEELIEKVEEEANNIESNFLKMFSEQPDEASRVPVFDFEIN